MSKYEWSIINNLYMDRKIDKNDHVSVGVFFFFFWMCDWNYVISAGKTKVDPRAFIMFNKGQSDIKAHYSSWSEINVKMWPHVFMLLSLDCFQTTCIQLGLSNHSIDQAPLWKSLHKTGDLQGVGHMFFSCKTVPFSTMQDVFRVMLCCDSYLDVPMQFLGCFG